MGKRENSELIKSLEAQGFQVVRVRNGHWKAIAPDGRKAQFAYSPSDHRAILNVRAYLKRRIGYDPKKK